MLSHSKSWPFAVLLSIFPCVFKASSNSGAPPVTYRTGSSEVRVTFFATDENDRLVDPLGKDDFAVVDSGMVIRDFRSLTRSNETALDVAVLADASESVAPRFPAVTERVLRLVHLGCQSDGDNVSVVTFSGLRPQLLCTRDCGATAERKLRAIKAAGATPLFDALTYTARIIASRHAPEVRPVLILFSDGNDTISAASARDALDAVIASGAVLYTINLAPSGDLSKGASLLQQMAEATGGRSFSQQESTGSVLQTVLEDQRSSYVVTYQLPSREPGFHSLCILPKHNLNLRFHCRRGYYYEQIP